MVMAPLSGLRVLDFTRFVSGSYATMILASLGAGVVKVEPAGGDPYRASETAGEESVLFLSLNSGKQSVVVDFRTPEGADIVEGLLATSSFFVENARPGSLIRYGLDYESVHERHPSLVYGSISGYGDVGPDATKGGFDLILQAETGIMSVTGAEHCGPVKVGAPVLDIGAGLCCVIGLLAAHIERQATGQGRHVSTSLFEFALASLSTVAADFLSTGVIPGLLGTHSPTFAPYGNFRTADGWLVLAGTGSEDLWLRMCRVLGTPRMADDPRFVNNASRVAHRDELSSDIEAILAADGSSVWLERFARAGIPATEIKGVDQVLNGEQIEALGMIQTLDRAGSGPYRVLGAPIRVDHQPLGVPGPAPVLGADTKHILSDMGFDADAIAMLETHGAVRAS